MEKYTQYPNDILEILPKSKLGLVEVFVIQCIIRNTLGWHKDRAEISYSYISKAIDRDLRNVKRIMKKLIELNIVIVYKEGTRTQPNIIGVNLDIYSWKVDVPLPPKKISEKENEGGKEMPVNDIDKLLSRYNPAQLMEVNRFIANIHARRKSGKAKETIIIKNLVDLDKYPVEYVEYGLKKYNSSHTDKKENYAIGIVRGSFQDKALEKIQKPKAKVISFEDKLRERGAL